MSLQFLESTVLFSGFLPLPGALPFTSCGSSQDVSCACCSPAYKALFFISGKPSVMPGWGHNPFPPSGLPSTPVGSVAPFARSECPLPSWWEGNGWTAEEKRVHLTFPWTAWAWAPASPSAFSTSPPGSFLSEFRTLSNDRFSVWLPHCPSMAFHSCKHSPIVWERPPLWPTDVCLPLQCPSPVQVAWTMNVWRFRTLTYSPWYLRSWKGFWHTLILSKPLIYVLKDE